MKQLKAITAPPGSALDAAQQHLRDSQEEPIVDFESALRRLSEEQARYESPCRAFYRRRAKTRQLGPEGYEYLIYLLSNNYNSIIALRNPYTFFILVYLDLFPP